MTTKKRVEIKLSKLIIVNKVESLWTSVNKWMRMAYMLVYFFVISDKVITGLNNKNYIKHIINTHVKNTTANLHMPIRYIFRLFTFKNVW